MAGAHAWRSGVSVPLTSRVACLRPEHAVASAHGCQRACSSVLAPPYASARLPYASFRLVKCASPLLAAILTRQTCLTVASGGFDQTNLSHRC
eukprot:934500-Pleurochrysis_carterae.AAC.2